MKKSAAENVIVALALLTCVLISVTVLATLWHKVYAQPTPAPAQVSQLGPDISHCFNDDETRELWDCIRHEGD